MNEKRTVVKVRIGGEEYSLKSDRSAEYTQAVADYVDRALQGVLKTGAMVENQKAAILAALSIADELFQARQEGVQLAARMDRLARDLSRLLPPKRRTSRVSASFASRENEG